LGSASVLQRRGAFDIRILSRSARLRAQAVFLPKTEQRLIEAQQRAMRLFLRENVFQSEFAKVRVCLRSRNLALPAK